MITELEHLAKKVDKIAQLVQTLRASNAELSNQLEELTAINADLTERIQEAHDRMSTLLEQAPFANQEQ